MTSGASTVTTSLFKSWPTFRKKLFQITHEKRSINRSVFNFNIPSNNKLIKLFSLPFFLFFIFKNSFKKKIDYFVIEGATWVGYIYFFQKILKILFKKSKFIYHSHNIEADIRKNKYLISKLTFFFEKKVLNNFDFVTAVSKKDQKIFKQKYQKDTLLLENGVFLENIKIKNIKKNYKYIIFPGSLEFIENKIIFEKLYNEIFPFLKSLDNKFKILITGSDIKFYEKDKNVIELGVLDKKSFLRYLISSWALIIPSKKGPGTKIKIIEALCYNKVVFASKDALSGIENNLTQNIIYKNRKELFRKLDFFYSNQSKILNKFKSIGKIYRQKYNMKIIAKNFYEVIERK